MKIETIIPFVFQISPTSIGRVRASSCQMILFLLCGTSEAQVSDPFATTAESNAPSQQIEEGPTMDYPISTTDLNPQSKKFQNIYKVVAASERKLRIEELWDQARISVSAENMRRQGGVTTSTTFFDRAGQPIGTFGGVPTMVIDEAKMKQLEARIPTMSAEVFIKRLRNGDFFLVDMGKLERCEKCGGFGKIHSNRSTNPDRKEKCSSCGGSGKIHKPAPYKIYLVAAESPR